MKKVFLTTFLLIILVSALWANILNFVPKNAEFVVQFRNNSYNYKQLKKVGVFSFLLNDLGIENLVQSSVSQSAVSMGVKAKDIWSMLQNDFVAFVEQNEENVSAEIVLKGSEKVVLGLFNFVGGKASSVKVGDIPMKIVKIENVSVYVAQDGDYVILSNSPTLIKESMETYKGKGEAFSFGNKIPNSAWFAFYTNGGKIDSTSPMILSQGYGYGSIENGTLDVEGTAYFKYEDENLKSKILSFKPTAVALIDMPASGDFWVGADVADPMELYNIIKKYSTQIGLAQKDTISDEMKDLVSSLTGKFFVDGSLASREADYALTVYLSKSLSKYIPELSKEASATFKWNGHTVLRDDTKEGTRVTHTYTVFYPDKIVLTDVKPEKSLDFTQAKTKAKDMGNFSTFEENILWKNSFLLGYFDVGKFTQSLFQYPLTSGLIVQMKFDDNANVKWQLVLK